MDLNKLLYQEDILKSKFDIEKYKVILGRIMNNYRFSKI